MLWWRRCLVIVPVLSFLAAAMLLSCGGGGSSSTVTQSPSSLESVAICPGTPVPPTPTPTPTTGKKSPTPTPTQCAPVTEATVAIGGTVGFNAQGTFTVHNKKQLKFRDVTGGAGWFPTNANIFYQGGGVVQGVAQGCSCLTAEAGGLTSQSVLIAVSTPIAACTPCPQLPTPTPTPK
jgi:hypothetical protein